VASELLEKGKKIVVRCTGVLCMVVECDDKMLHEFQRVVVAVADNLRKRKKRPYLTWPIQGLNEVRKDVLDVHELAGLYIYIYWLYPM
jgi:hypothetical protein